VVGNTLRWFISLQTVVHQSTNQDQHKSMALTKSQCNNCYIMSPPSCLTQPACKITANWARYSHYL